MTSREAKQLKICEYFMNYEMRGRANNCNAQKFAKYFVYYNLSKGYFLPIQIQIYLLHGGRVFHLC